MTGLTLPGFLFVVLSFPGADDADPADLVPRLGAPRYADREAAGEALVKIGRAAMPALIKACESRDAEIRQRAGVLVTRIEATDVLKATPVRLGIRDRPLAEAAEIIGRESGMMIRPVPRARQAGGEPSWPEDRRVTLEAAGPLPFWDALDRLCAAGGLCRLSSLENDSFFPFKSPFDLHLAPGHSSPPALDTGALRVELLRIRYDRNRDYGGGDGFEFSPFQGRPNRRFEAGTGALVGSSYQAELLVSAEPRLKIFGVGAVEKAEAVDDRGRSLLRMPTDEERRREAESLRLNPHSDPRLNPGLRFDSGSRSSRRTWPVTILLDYPAPPARRIKVLRGVLPVVVAARRPVPLVVDLKGAAGKSFASGATRITVHEVSANSGQDPTIDLTLEIAPDAARETMTVFDPRGSRLTVNSPIDLMELGFEVIDARGDGCFWQFTRAPTERTHGRFAVVVHRKDYQSEPPKDLRLRYWQVIGASTDLPFSFSDVPTP